MPFQVKICGVTSVEDALVVADSGADAVGLNFYEKTKRYVDLTTARDISAKLPRELKRVGVFVNASIATISEAVEVASLDFVQLHGDEPPSFLDQLAGVSIIRAFRCKADLSPVHQYLSECNVMPVAVLLDAYSPDAYGGTGEKLYWPDLAGVKFEPEIPLILAGGLTPDNVSEAISQARPQGVDVASGVEKKPQVGKDAELCDLFVRSAKSAFRSNP